MAEKAIKKVIKGTVVSDKMDKTIVVQVSRTYRHPRFEKVMRSVKKYKVHDEHEQAKMGDVVHIVEGRPRSKDKYMYLQTIVSE